ncbi:MAG TPA: hypothetical protein DCM54_04165 [Gammaproteobacteria bacterium]|nr:hypothetical protein [Gammaproteobacteria bacterium]
MSGYRCATPVTGAFSRIEIDMKRVWAVLSLLLVLSGCGSEDGFNEQDLRIPSGFVRIVHAMADAPGLTVEIQAQRLPRLDFGEATSFQPALPDIDRDLDITFFNGVDDTSVLSQTINIPNGRLFTLIIGGTLAAPELTTIINEQAESGDNVTVQIFNGSVNTSGSYDVFLTSGDEVATAPTAQLSQFQVSQPLSRAPASDYRIQFSETGSDEILWDSGAFEIFDGSANPLFVILDNFGTGPNQVRIVGFDNTTISFPEDQTPSAVRVAHMIADDVPLDLFIDSQLVAQAISFQEVSEIQDITPGEKVFSAVRTDDPENVILEQSIIITPGNYHTLAAFNTADDPLTAINVDQFRRVDQAMTLGISAFSASAGPINIYLIRSGENREEFGPVSQRSYGETLTFTIPENDYDLFINAAQTNSEVAGPLQIPAASRGLYRVYVTDQVGGGSPVQLVVGDDLNPPFDP